LCREALKANPNDAVMLSDLAMFVASEGNERQEPLVLIERALALAPQDTDVQFNAAETYESLGYRKEALDWVAKLIAAGVSAGRHQPEPGARGPRQGQTLPEHSPGTEKIGELYT
jgi:tetratricopeptide (TPR) repeat protein